MLDSWYLMHTQWFISQWHKAVGWGVPSPARGVEKGWLLVPAQAQPWGLSHVPSSMHQASRIMRQNPKWFTHSSNHSFFSSFSHSLIHSFIHACMHAFIHSFIHSSNHNWSCSYQTMKASTLRAAIQVGIRIPQPWGPFNFLVFHKRLFCVSEVVFHLDRTVNAVENLIV